MPPPDDEGSGTRDAGVGWVAGAGVLGDEGKPRTKRIQQHRQRCTIDTIKKRNFYRKRPYEKNE